MMFRSDRHLLLRPVPLANPDLSAGRGALLPREMYRLLLQRKHPVGSRELTATPAVVLLLDHDDELGGDHSQSLPHSFRQRLYVSR